MITAIASPERAIIARVNGLMVWTRRLGPWWVLWIAGCVEAHVIDCSVDDHPVCVAEAGPRDAGVRDAGARDAGLPDAGPRDAGGDGGPDAGDRVDGGPIDAGPIDGGPIDGGPIDGGPIDGGPIDGGLGFCEGALTCDVFGDGSLTSGLVVSGVDSPAWTISNVDADSWQEIVLSGPTEEVLASGPGPSGSWWGNTCAGALAQTGPALAYAPAFAVGAGEGFSIDVDYFMSSDGCGQGIVGVGLADTSTAVDWAPPAPHFGGRIWFYAMAGGGVELRNGVATSIYDSGLLALTPTDTWYHLHVEVCADGRYSITHSLRDDPSTVYVENTRAVPNAQLDLPRSYGSLGVFLFAEGAEKYFDNLRVVSGCSL
jgi:hypothetical protein